MMRALIATAAAACLLTSCATNASYRDTVVSPAVSDISGSPVFIYSFLDLWTPYVGTDLVESTDRQLTSRFAQHSVQVSIVHLYNSGHIIRNYEARGNDYIGRRESMRVPVEEIVGTHRDAERALGARYRLIGVPQDITSSGGTAQWLLVDIASDQMVWRTSMQISFGDFSGGTIEEIDRSYAAIVDGLFDVMRASGVLTP